MIRGACVDPDRATRDERAAGRRVAGIRQLAGEADGAMLVRGVDEFGYYVPERPPDADLSPAARAHHAECVARSAKILYRGTGVERFR